MSFGIKVEVWGDRALFTRPELSVERVSYDCITPSAARGVLESIYWHPGLRYVVDRIHVINQIKFTNVRRNEVKSKASAADMRSTMLKGGPIPYLNAQGDIAQRASVMLRDVRYVIEAHFEMTEAATAEDSPGKFISILKRRLERGAAYSQPYFGTRECSCFFKEADEDNIPTSFYQDESERDLGLMLYDMDYKDPQNITPMFFRAVMHNGIIDVSRSEVLR